MKKRNNRIAIFVGHPAHFHLFKNVANRLIEKGFQIDFLVKRKDIVEQLVIDAGYNYYIVRSQERQGSTRLSLVWALIKMFWNMTVYGLKRRPSLLIGTCGPITYKLLGIPVITTNEDDANVVPRFVKTNYPFSSVILAPNVCDCGKWNQKAIKYASYQELAYLHPQNFQADKTVVEKYFSTNQSYCIIRFAKLNAHHDNGIKGLTTKIAQRIIDIIKPYMNIYITSERELEPQFERYRIKISPVDMHHVMAFASLYVGDSQTMAAEAGVLGVPFVRFNDFVGKIGYLKDLEVRYHLGYGVKTCDVDCLYEIVDKLVKMSNKKQVFLERRLQMLSDKIDYSAFLTWFIENYPESKAEMERNPNYQFNFK